MNLYGAGSAYDEAGVQPTGRRDYSRSVLSGVMATVVDCLYKAAPVCGGLIETAAL